MNARFKAILIIVVLSVLLTPDFIYINEVIEIEIATTSGVARPNARGQAITKT